MAIIVGKLNAVVKAGAVSGAVLGQSGYGAGHCHSRPGRGRQAAVRPLPASHSPGGGHPDGHEDHREGRGRLPRLVFRLLDAAAARPESVCSTSDRHCSSARSSTAAQNPDVVSTWATHSTRSCSSQRSSRRPMWSPTWIGAPTPARSSPRSTPGSTGWKRNSGRVLPLFLYVWRDSV